MTDVDGKNVHGPTGEKFDVTLMWGMSQRSNSFGLVVPFHRFNGYSRSAESEQESPMRSDC